MIKRGMMAVFLAALTGACLPPDPTIGKGQVHLTPTIQQAFEQYKHERSPGHFAVSADGRYAHYNYCPENRCLRGSKTQAIYGCEKRSKGSPCKIYGAYGEVVWENPNG
ncbi:MAG: hypothetical protein R3F54_23915 [Alphaproteobacteria bacterium]